MNLQNIIIVYKKTSKKDGKLFLHILKETKLDDVLSLDKRKPLIPYTWDIIQIGVGGTTLESHYREKYKIK